MTYLPRYRPRHSAELAVEKRYPDVPSMHQKLAEYFAYWPACAVDFWRREQDVADMHAGLHRIKEALDVPGPGAKPIQTTPGPGHQIIRDDNTIDPELWASLTDEKRDAFRVALDRMGMAVFEVHDNRPPEDVTP